MTNNVKLFEVLNWASLFLEKHHRERNIAELLLRHHLQISRAELFSQMRETIPEHVIQTFKADIKKHALTGIPLQHLIGYSEFYGRNFHVNEDVLIPRPETEELVAQIIHDASTQFSKNESLTIVDLGTGSGVIAITLALELPQAKVYATDISEAALSIARENAKNLQADVSFFHGDFLQPIIARNIKAEMIVSNPPYISPSEKRTLSDTVKNFDPEIALFAENDGYQAYEAIITDLPEVMKPEAKVYFEIGHQQGDTVRALLKKKFPHCEVNIMQDINGKDRMVITTL